MSLAAIHTVKNENYKTPLNYLSALLNPILLTAVNSKNENLEMGDTTYNNHSRILKFQHKTCPFQITPQFDEICQSNELM